MSDTTVTMPLQEFDSLRRDRISYHNDIKQQRKIGDCYEYFCDEAPPPKKCKTCEHGKDKPSSFRDVCDSCEAYQNHNEFIEKFIVDVERLIAETKRYALRGKGLEHLQESDIDEMKIERKKGR